MPDSLSDHALSDILSARSYLGLAHEADAIHPPTETVAPQSIHEFAPEKPVGGEGNSARRLRPRTTRRSQKELKPPENPEMQDPHLADPTVDRPVRKRGRPRLDTAKNDAAIEERRLQIRRAQRTYRQKKEATIQALKTRVEILEQALHNISDVLDGERDNAISASTRPDNLARARQLALAEINKARASVGDPDQKLPYTPSTLHEVFGYQVSHNRRDMQDDTNSRHPQKRRSPHRTQPYARSPSPLLNRLFPSTAIYTYSYQEPNFSRRLQRFCVEHTYRWLMDPHTDPGHMARVFGLLPCIHDMPGIRRNFRRLLYSEIGGQLELNKLPFYTLGGASTHYPRLGPDGRPVRPENLRRPGKILRRMARILRRGGIQNWDEDWSGDAEPDTGDDGGKMENVMPDEDRLRALDLDGKWFDCHDVQGYLEHRGVVLHGSSLWLDVPSETVGDLYGLAFDESPSYEYMSSGGASPVHTSESWHPSLSGYVLDVECFFDLLLPNLRVLGRAPGFRSRDVDAALRTAIHRRPSPWLTRHTCV